LLLREGIFGFGEAPESFRQAWRSIPNLRGCSGGAAEQGRGGRQAIAAVASAALPILKVAQWRGGWLVGRHSGSGSPSRWITAHYGFRKPDLVTKTGALRSIIRRRLRGRLKRTEPDRRPSRSRRAAPSPESRPGLIERCCAFLISRRWSPSSGCRAGCRQDRGADISPMASPRYGR
jgi:hypothetical protein